MLPLPLYFADEFRLIPASQLFRAVQQSALCNSDALKLQFEALGFKFRQGQVLEAEPEGASAHSSPPALIHLPYTNTQANHRFNLYLQAIEAHDQAITLPTAQPVVNVNPLHLHPNCSVTPSANTFEILVRKLTALTQVARAHNVRLQLAAPGEEQLELWLKLIARVLSELSSVRSSELSSEPSSEPSEAAIGLTISATSNRLLPSLGYLARLSLDTNRTLAIRLIRGKSHNNAKQEQIKHAPTGIDSPEIAELNFAAACAFFESENSAHLNPELAIDGPGLRPDAPTTYRRHDYPTPCTLKGIDSITQQFAEALNDVNERPIQASPIIAGTPRPEQETATLFCPGAIHSPIGSLVPTTESQARAAYSTCNDAQLSWQALPVDKRCTSIQSFATLLAQRQIELATLCARETGKPTDDCLLEIEDALTLLSQHLNLVSQLYQPKPLHSIEGTESQLFPRPLGCVLGLPLWNQPILQFCAMSSAALLTGNAILFKPDAHASLVSTRLFQLLLQAGIPPQLIALMPGPLATAGSALLDDHRLGGVLFTGSPLAAGEIQHRLGKQLGIHPLPLLSDTGGVHAALIDADQSAEELLPLLLKAAFSHAGQHPASLRILYLEETIADDVEQLLCEALPYLRVGQAESRDTDIGPLITREQMDRAYLHIERFRVKGRLIAQPELHTDLEEGYFIPPTLLRLYTLDELQEQVEAPVLHLVRFNRDDVIRLHDEINRSGFAMAVSVFSNDQQLCDQAMLKLKVSELNINPAQLYPHSSHCPGLGIGLSGTAPLPGTVDYLRALMRLQRISQPPTRLADRLPQVPV
ncbi:hypothetical protein GCM10011352_21630 [Marinobacterium zhoushanense]|uniref:Aldehyde dehydrogenase domain-containing protein n=1 Tax=Marinobacterium zhoushanense TaxID=1679163 RepID=A0ABQ1KGW8_9GAMM|nr:aldehyde dehydrogenase family protein [Marinobacterium zhoushanense]GGB95221.1 hypothetical protein GCM10011352_21630 [Marinobacterium zhoushanense]